MSVRYVEADGLERTFRYRQSDMMPAVPVASQQNYFDLKLEQLGPYCLDYSRNGRYVCGSASGEPQVTNHLTHSSSDTC